jgi:8-oxo-dGTP pyrophosphatase MutT (NUDIX family)
VRWTIHGERVIYESDWVRLALTDVELPSGKRFEHHVVRMPYHAAGTVVDDPDRGVLLLWRHRFTTGTWGWEVPAGRIDEGETAAEAAVRETLEETGWRPGPVTLMTSYFPHNGLSDSTFHLFAATSAEHVGDPCDGDEAERVEWLPWPDVVAEMRAGRVGDGLSLTALLWRLGMEAPGTAGRLPG